LLYYGIGIARWLLIWASHYFVTLLRHGVIMLGEGKFITFFVNQTFAFFEL
jgi:hypothetical protein